MGNGNPEADPGAQDRFSLLHRAENLVVSASRPIDQVTGELGDDAGFVSGNQGHYYPIWREQFGQEHEITWSGMESNLHGVSGWGNALLQLMLGPLTVIFHNVDRGQPAGLRSQ